MANPMADPVPEPAPADAARPAMSGGRGGPGAVRPLALRLAMFAAAAVACGLSAPLGAWFVPFLAGLAAGALAARRSRGAVLPAVAGAVTGWGVTLWLLALRGLPVGATARSIAALAGLPPYAAVAITVTLLLAALQAFAGAWLARAVLPAGPRHAS